MSKIPDAQNPKIERDKHRERCKSHMVTVHSAYRNRALPDGRLELLNLVLGKKRKCYASYLPASDLRLRDQWGRHMIYELVKLRERMLNVKGVTAHLVTFVDEDFIFNERTGVANVTQLRRKIDNAFRYHAPKLNALVIIELQAMTNYPKGSVGKSLCLHAHAVCYGPNAEQQLDKLCANAKSFKAKLTSRPIYSNIIKNTESDFARVGRYLAKPPFEGKWVNYVKLKQGKACLQSTTEGLKKHHHLRLFEFQAKIPMSEVVFGIRKGSQIRGRVKKEVSLWAKNASYIIFLLSILNLSSKNFIV